MAYVILCFGLGWRRNQVGRGSYQLWMLLRSEQVPRLSIFLGAGDGEYDGFNCLVLEWWDWVGPGMEEGVFPLHWHFIQHFLVFLAALIFLSLPNLQVEQSGALHPWHSPHLFLVEWHCGNCLLICGLSVAMGCGKECGSWTAGTTSSFCPYACT